MIVFEFERNSCSAVLRSVCIFMSCSLIKVTGEKDFAYFSLALVKYVALTLQTVQMLWKATAVKSDSGY